jgi:hypothetical protein
MFSKPFAVGLLALACVTAAAGGAYVAVRQNQAPPVPAEPAPAVSTPAVQETEAIVSPAVSPDEPLESTAPAQLAERPQPRQAEPPAVARRTPPPARERLERPSTAPVSPPPASRPEPAPASPAPSTPAADATDAVPRPQPSFEPAPAPARPEPPPAPVPVFDELVVPSASVVGLQIETPVSSERAKVEDRVEARVLRDVLVDGRTAVPAGARAIGAVTLVEQGGKMKERARLGVRFHTLVLADGTELPMRTETILREGQSPAGESARKIGGAAVGGAILGAIMGGKKGAIIGGATGAAGGSAVVMAGDRNPATLPVGAVVTVRLSAPVTVQVERR